MPGARAKNGQKGALITPAKSSAKKPVKRTEPLASYNSSSDPDEFGKLLKSVKSIYKSNPSRKV